MFVGIIINIYLVFGNVFKCSNCLLLINVIVCVLNNKIYKSECYLVELNCVNNEKWKIFYYGKCRENRIEEKGNV